MHAVKCSRASPERLLRSGQGRSHAAWRYPSVEPAVIFPILAVLVLAACVAVPIYMVRRARGPEPRELPPLIFSAGRGWQGEPLDTIYSETPAVTAAAATRSFAPVHVDPVTVGPIDVDAVDSTPAGTETVHFRRPTDQAVQLLPGRLVVLSGLTMPGEIRFVRVPGERPQ